MVLPENSVSNHLSPQQQDRRTLKKFSWLHYVVVPGVFVLLMFLFFPARGKFELFTDEGVNLIKALLVERGYTLYDEIWSDQPPLLTQMLAVSIRVFGAEVGVARGVVLFLSVGLVGAAFAFMALWRKTYAYAAVGLILLTPGFLSLSLAVLVGLPSIAFGMGALLCLGMWHRGHQISWLVASALLLSMAALTKLMIGFLAPIFGVGILLDALGQFRVTRQWRDLLWAPGVWGTTFGGFLFLGVVTLVGFENLDQLVGDHLSATASAFYAVDPSLHLSYYLPKFWAFLILALIGTGFAVLHRQWPMLYLTVWTGAAFYLIGNHLPVWFHHLPYIVLPAAMLGGIALVESVKWFGANLSRVALKKSGWLRAAAVIGVVCLAGQIIQTNPLKPLRWPPSLTSSGLDVGTKVERVLATMIDYRAQTHWLFTDAPMFAFRARLPVPPELAVITDKRLRTGYLTDEEILATVKRYQPEQVLLGRFTLPGLSEYLEANYQLVARKEDELKLYIRNDLLSEP